jgi:ZIP family zinc transporter
VNLPAGVVWLRQRVGPRGEVMPGAGGGPGPGVEVAVVTEPAARAGWGWVAGLAVAVALTTGAVFLMGRAGLEGLLRPSPAPVPQLAFERVVFGPGQVTVSVRNTGRVPLQIRQVTVDDAYRVFTAEPASRLERFGRTRLHVPYPWVAGEPLDITVFDSTGLTFTENVKAAAETPVAGGRTVAGYVLLGTYVGVVPVFLGLLFLPALARLGRRGLRFLLGLTGGLLVFLAVEAGSESLELAGKLPAVFHGPALVFAGAAGTYAGLAYLGRRRRAGSAPTGDGRAGPGRAVITGTPRAPGVSPLGLAFLVAVGIGLHNFGEGLAIGSAQARGEVALGTALVVGFALHNLTEGIGIAAPTMQRLPDWRRLVGLGAVAGLPTVAGTLVGGLAYSTVLGTLFLAVGIGAIAVVLDELGRYARRQAGAPGVLLAGAASGFALMYVTALMVGV